MKLLNKIKRKIKASILCIRFPFLYPRNRWDGRYHSGILSHTLYQLRIKSEQELYITGRLEKDPNVRFNSWDFFPNCDVRLDKEKKLLTIKTPFDTIEYDLTVLLWRDDRFEILGVTCRGKSIIIHVKTRDESDKTNYGFTSYTIRYVYNKFKHCQYKILSWVVDKIVDKIFFIPNYTELDAMPSGWRKAFGIEMCKEIKQELNKHKGALRKYRITQIKEKFGGLCWYDAYSTERIWKEIIPKYEKLSYKTCINCGKPAEYIQRGWISPYCDECINKNREYVSITDTNAWDKALYGEDDL